MKNRAVALAAFVAVTGCSHSLDHASRGGASIAASTSTVAPGATAKAPPTVVVTRPAPGAWVQGPDVTVEGTARVPGRTIVSVDVGGAPALVRADGTFEGKVRLPDPGIATVTVRAKDSMGVEHFRHVSWVRGPFGTGEVADALQLRLEPVALPAANDLVQEELRKLDIEALLKGLNPLPVDVVKGIVSVDLEFVKVTYAPPTTAIAFGQGSIDVQGEFRTISVDVIVRDKLGPIPITIPARLTATRALATARASLVVPAQGPIASQLTPPTVAVDDLAIPSTSLATLLANLVRAKVEQAIEKVLADVIVKHVPRILDKAIVNATTSHRIALGNGTVDLALRPVRADIAPTGCAFTIAADVIPVVTGLSLDYPVRGTTPPVLGGTTRAVRLALSRDVLSKALVGLWRAGSLDYELRPGVGTGASLPLDASSLGKLIPELATAVKPATPLVVRVKPRCPPELRLAPGQTPFVLALGEVHLELLADENGVLRSLITIAAHAEVPVDVVVGTNASGASTISVVPSPVRPRFLFSVVEQPIVRVDEQRLAVRLTVLVDAVLDKAFTPLDALALPSVLGKPIVDAEVSLAQPGFDHLVVGASLK